MLEGHLTFCHILTQKKYPVLPDQASAELSRLLRRFITEPMCICMPGVD